MPSPALLPAHVDEPQAAQEYAEVLSRVAADRKPVIVHRGGADLAAVVPLEYLELLQDMLAGQEAQKLLSQLDWEQLIKTSPPRKVGSMATNRNRSDGCGERVMTPPLRCGQIVWAELADANGVRKAHHRHHRYTR